MIPKPQAVIAVVVAVFEILVSIPSATFSNIPKQRFKGTFLKGCIPTQPSALA
jgi:hypothetical protein